MRSVFRRRAVATTLLLVLAIGLFIIGRLLSKKGMDWAGQFGSIAAAFIAFVTLLQPIFVRWFRGPSPISTLNVRQATDDLVSSFREQLDEEEQLRRVNDPRPLPVRWEVTAQARAAMPGVSLGSVGNDFETPPPTVYAGQFDDIVSVFNEIPSHRLVILGPAGAGKTVLATKLARELLTTWQYGTPVPVILPAASWDPDSNLATWISHQLTSDHPGLAVQVKSTIGEATSLADSIAAGSVLPIIDGLDELPDGLRTKVIIEINAAGSHLPFVVTSRSEEYLIAVTDAGRAISRAMVVEVLPLRVPEVKAYLAEATAAVPAQRWDKVFDRLDEQPQGALASVLANPLMLWLARTVYEPGRSDPSELTVHERFGDAQTIEHHLLDALVPTVYARGPSSARYHWTPEQAQRWLTFLANYLETTGSPMLEWWRLTGSVRIWRPVGTVIRWLLLSSIATVLLVWVLRQNGEWQGGKYYHRDSLLDLLLGGPLGRAILPYLKLVLHYFFPPYSVHIIRLQMGEGLRWLSGGSYVSLEVRGAVMAALLGILMIATFRWPAQPKLIRGKFTRTMITKLAKDAGIFVAIFISLNAILQSIMPAAQAVAGLLSLSGVIWLRVFVALLIASALASAAASCTSPLDIDEIDPSSSLQLDRKATLLKALPTKASDTALLWLWSGAYVAIAYGVFSVASTLCRVFLGGTATASDQFADCRIWMFCRRRLPWRAMAFLVDAHQRGVLRQVGALYQFRHIRLQQRLAAQYSKQPHRWEPLVEEITEIMSVYTDRVAFHFNKIDPEQLRVRLEYGWEAERVGLGWIYRDPRFDQMKQNPRPNNN